MPNPTFAPTSLSATAPNGNGASRCPQRWLVFYNARVEPAIALGQAITAYLQQQAVGQVLLASMDDASALAVVPSQEMMIVLGGDGSILRGSEVAAPYNIPLLGINLGRLGFLGEIEPAHWEAGLAQVLAGDYWLETRMRLQVEHWRAEQYLGRYTVLNESVIGRGALARPVRLKTCVDGWDLTTYVADGLIVATPTGSTAYALAVGGPILPPEMCNLLLIAIAPHLSFDRALVLPAEAVVEVTIRTDHQAILSADGHIEIALQDQDIVRVQRSPHSTHFVRIRPRNYFYTNLMARMPHNPAAEKTS